MSGYDVSDDGKLLAYGLAVAGSDWQQWKVREIETGKDLTDDVQWVKFSGASWKQDGSGFFYSRYDAPASADQLKQANYFHKLYFHKLGTTQDKDTLIYERKDHKDWNFSGDVTEDGRFLIIDVRQGTDPKNRIFYKDLQKADAPVVELLNKQDAAYDFLGCEGNTFWFKTDLDAPKGRIVAIDISKPENITTVVPEAADKLEGVEPGRRPVCRQLSQGRAFRDQALRSFRKSRGRDQASGIGHGERFQRETQRHRDILFLCEFHRAIDHLPLRFQERPKLSSLPPESRLQVRRLHDRTGFLSRARMEQKCRCS